MYALHIKPKVSLGFGAGGMLRQYCTDSGYMFHSSNVRNVSAGTQGHDVLPACLSSNCSLVYNKAVPVWDDVLLLSPGRWDCSGQSDPEVIQTAQTVGVQRLRGHWDLLSQR